LPPVSASDATFGLISSSLWPAISLVSDLPHHPIHTSQLSLYRPHA
jgi:hypothetical protein